MTIREVTITPEVISKKLHREIINKLVELYRESHLGKRQLAYDGRKSVYTAGPLPFSSKDFVIKLVDQDRGARKDREFKVLIKFAAKPDIHHLQEFMRGRQLDTPQETIQVLDVVLRATLLMNDAVVGRSFFSPSFGVGDLGNGFQYWKGFYQSLRPIQMGLSLNIDMSARAFYEPILVTDFVAKYFNVKDLIRPLSDQECLKVALWLDIGRVFLGFGIGVHCFAAPAYIGEITPKNSRGAFTAVNQLMLTCGLSLVYFVGNVVTWRTLAIIGTIPSLVEVIGLFFIPESPRWLVKVGKEKELEASLRRLRGQNVDISQEAAEIRDYLELAQQLPKSSFIDMFQWKYAHSLTIGVGIVLLAIFGGTVAISYYASSIFESAGCSATLGTTVLAIIQIPFSILGVVLMDKSGRRPLWMISAAGTCVGNILVGLGFLLKDFDQKKEITAVLVLAGILVYGSSFSIGISGAPWIILSEMLPIDIKGSAGSFITFLVWASSWIVAYTFNFVLQWSSAGSFFIFAGICGSTVLFVVKLVPETKGRTLEEIQASLSLFQQPKR